MKHYFAILIVLVCLTTFADDSLKIYLFASSTCEKCEYLKKLVLPDVLEAYPAVSYEHIKVDDINNFKLQLQYEKYYQQALEESGKSGFSRPSTLGLKTSDYRFIGKEDASVKAFVGKTCLAGVEIIEKKLEEAVKRELSLGNQTITPSEMKQLVQDQNRSTKSNANTDLVKEKYDSFGWTTVAGAGLFDGINPCAFVTLVFFISVLANLRKSKRDIFVVGLLFSLAVFATYLLLGVGALKFIKIISVQAGVAKGINIAMAGFCIIIGVVSLIDVFKFRKTHKADFKLKLPKSFRKIINRQINTKMRKKHLWFWAIFLGVSVSLLESACTGQIYLPIITSMVKKGSSEAFALLLLYNLMFILPLLIVFGVTLAGVSSKQITNFFMKNLLLSKILMTLLFFFLGVYLLLGIRL